MSHIYINEYISRVRNINLYDSLLGINNIIIRITNYNKPISRVNLDEL